jgi:hypothetical protein
MREEFTPSIMIYYYGTLKGPEIMRENILYDVACPAAAHESLIHSLNDKIETICV